jgi:hypothetical protein
LLTWLFAVIVPLSALARTKFLAGNFPLTQIHFGKCSLVAPAFPFFLGKVHW